MEQKQKKSLADKLKSLLNNKEFKDLINAYNEDKEEAYDFKSFKEELLKTKIEKRKKNALKHINKNLGILNKEKIKN